MKPCLKLVWYIFEFYSQIKDVKPNFKENIIKLQLTKLIWTTDRNEKFKLDFHQWHYHRIEQKEWKEILHCHNNATCERKNRKSSRISHILLTFVFLSTQPPNKKILFNIHPTNHHHANFPRIFSAHFYCIVIMLCDKCVHYK